MVSWNYSSQKKPEVPLDNARQHCKIQLAHLVYSSGTPIPSVQGREGH